MQTQEELIREIHNEVTIIKTVLLGAPNSDDKGLIGEIKDIKKNYYELNHRVGRLSKTVWILIGILAGSGVLGAGLWNLLAR